MKSIQFYFILKEVTEKEDIAFLLQLYRLSAESDSKGVQASTKLEQRFNCLKKSETEHSLL